MVAPFCKYARIICINIHMIIPRLQAMCKSEFVV